MVVTATPHQERTALQGAGRLAAGTSSARASGRALHPPGTQCSVITGTEITSVAEGSAQGLHVVAPGLASSVATAGIRARFPAPARVGPDRGSHDRSWKEADAMDGSSLIFIIVPIVIPIALFTGIALPFIASAVRAQPRGRQPGRAHELKRINAAKRKARPPKPGAHNAPRRIPVRSLRSHSAPATTRPRHAAGSKRCRSSRRRPSGSTTPATPGTEARPLSPPAASAAKSSRPTPGATITARGISPLAWYALRTAAATATACISWPRAGTATLPAAAGKTARQAPAACAAQSTVTRGSTAHTGTTRAVTDTRPA